MKTFKGAFSVEGLCHFDMHSPTFAYKLQLYYHLSAFAVIRPQSQLILYFSTFTLL